MPDLPVDPGPRRTVLSRRAWLAVTLGGGVSARGAEPKREAKEPPPEVAEVLERARMAKLRGFRWSQNAHYLGIGDAGADFREDAMGICLKLATAYGKQFRDKGFAVELPAKKLVIITLKGRASYKAFQGEAPGEDVGGHYDLDRNELVMFDFRQDEIDRNAAPKRINTFTLVHEAIHQLTFNTGLLNRLGDVPKCISEGLATYGELWQPRGRASLGPINRPRLEVITQPKNQGVAWVALDQLLSDDDLFAQAATQQLAYAQSWLLVHYLMRAPKLPKFRAYLRALQDRKDPKVRLKDAKAVLGDLNGLDGQLQQYATQLG